MRCQALSELPPPSPGKAGWPWTEESPRLPGTMPDGQAWPRISIVTPSYNQGAFLEETIRSVLLQGYPDLEYLVIDGGSQDGSLAVIRKYEPWLEYWVSEPDRGQSHAINKGWERTSGDVITYLNSDDFYFPFTLQKVAQAWRGDPDAAVISGGVAFTDEFSCVTYQRAPQLSVESPLDLSLLDPLNWFLPQQSTFFIREKLDRVGRQLREELHYTMDRELLYRLCMQGKVLLIQDILAGDRQHSRSKRLSQTIKMYQEDAAALAYCSWGGRQENSRRKSVARLRLAQGHFILATHTLSRLEALCHLSATAFYRPSQLRRRGFMKALLQSVGLLSNKTKD